MVMKWCSKDGGGDVCVVVVVITRIIAGMVTGVDSKEGELGL